MGSFLTAATAHHAISLAFFAGGDPAGRLLLGACHASCPGLGGERPGLACLLGGWSGVGGSVSLYCSLCAHVMGVVRYPR
ncbi:hypothetical protein TUN199_05730 [Pyrenophora tritici-repentis]|nr:hypothetical protein PtrV1_07472 [Pyrenophora tritici-repentis]KAI0582475.1 hypothetical protein Alg215_04101 [Pyrenophora tritici-repentis]KAI0610327.1 hypothetical protein TUN205_05436 [Pyrenophora tritici-repentis]KAI0622288.1 hypothetical protein TUN199_05730 [Pyrenophora tritici-repentis]